MCIVTGNGAKMRSTITTSGERQVVEKIKHLQYSTYGTFWYLTMRCCLTAHEPSTAPLHTQTTTCCATPVQPCNLLWQKLGFVNCYLQTATGSQQEKGWLLWLPFVKSNLQHHLVNAVSNTVAIIVKKSCQDKKIQKKLIAKSQNLSLKLP